MKIPRRLLLTRQSAGYLAFCGCGALIMLLAGIGPAWRNLRTTRMEIDQLRAERDFQRMVHPIVEGMINARRTPVDPLYTVPATVPMTPDAITQLPEPFARLAEENGIQLRSLIPRFGVARNDASILPVLMTGRGGWHPFRDFLLAVLLEPSTAAIGDLEIRALGEGVLEYRMQIDLYLQKE